MIYVYSKLLWASIPIVQDVLIIDAKCHFRHVDDISHYYDNIRVIFGWPDVHIRTKFTTHAELKTKNDF